MAYSLQIADAVSATIGKFATLNNFQLAGHVANLDFWTRQVRNALDALDGYSKRQEMLVQAQKEYIAAHDTRHFFLDDLELYREFPEIYELGGAGPDRRRIDSESLERSRKQVIDSFYRFLRRCHTEKLIVRENAKHALDTCGVGIESGDFQDD